jgi:hypothetical protein
VAGRQQKDEVKMSTYVVTSAPDDYGLGAHERFKTRKAANRNFDGRKALRETVRMIRWDEYKGIPPKVIDRAVFATETST